MGLKSESKIHLSPAYLSQRADGRFTLLVNNLMHANELV